MPQFPALEAFLAQGSITVLSLAPKPVIKEVQFILGVDSDGIAGTKTMQAFVAFKAKNYLSQPTMLGATTAEELLDASNQHVHAVPLDAPEATHSGVKMTLPTGKIVWSNDAIIQGGHFTWGELTKNCSRVPSDRTVEGNLIKLAHKLEDVRRLLGDCSIFVNSGYRDPRTNRAVGGVSNSRHVTGEAVDIVPAIGLQKAYSILNAQWGYGLGNGTHRGFLHLDIRPYRCRFGY